MRLRVPSCTLVLALLALGTPAWAGNNKVQVCHIPPGNPSNFHTITISENALSAHLGHGDLAGACFAHCDTLCSDGNACTIDACDASEHCVNNHPPVNCDDSTLCTTDSCNPATGCANVPKICSDGNNCTVDACDSVTGSCVAPPVFCPAGQTCNPANGSCEGNACSPNPCQNEGTCQASGGGYTCACAPGFTGTNCEIASGPCSEDPCRHGVCLDEGEDSDSHICVCQPGYTGGNCQINIDDCAPNPCVHGMCTDLEDNYFCTCEPGWDGENCEQPVP